MYLLQIQTAQNTWEDLAIYNDLIEAKKACDRSIFACKKNSRLVDFHFIKTKKDYDQFQSSQLVIIENIDDIQIIYEKFYYRRLDPDNYFNYEDECEEFNWVKEGF